MRLDANLPDKPGLKPGATGEEVTRLQRLLIDLGYLHHSERYELDGMDTGHAVSAVRSLGEFDQATALALGAFQQGQGLEASQVLDEATFAVMNQVFCRATASESQPRQVYSYQILNTHPDLPGAELPRAIEQAFAIWSVHTPLAFVPAMTGSDPDITFRFAPIQGLGNAIIEFNENVRWRLGPQVGGLSSSYDFISVAVHEIGHKLGLNHTSPAVPGSVMNETIGNSTLHRFLHAIDIERIRAIFGMQTIREVPLVHGTSVTPESAGQLDDYRPMGPFTRVVGMSGLSSSWFHFAVPAPLLHAGTTARVHAVRLTLRAYPDSEITRVHIWEGNTFLGQHLLHLPGSVSPDVPRLWNLRLGIARKAQITRGGIGISVDIKFKHGTQASRRVDFVSAGADFIDPQISAGQVFLAE
jgi:hypothetical protein